MSSTQSKRGLMLLDKWDQQWLTSVAMPALGIKQVNVTEDLEHKDKYPDIWVVGRTITLTQAWKRYGRTARRVHLLHELLHIYGLSHDSSIGFNSHPEKDRFSRNMMRLIERGV